jgi:hypothetical protein
MWLEGESALCFWRQLRIHGAVRSMVEWDDEGAARSCFRTRSSNQMLLLAVVWHSRESSVWHSRESSVTMMPLIATPPLTHSTGIP